LFFMPQFEPQRPRVSYSGPSVAAPLNLPFVTFDQLPQAIPQSKQAFLRYSTRVLIASELIPVEPSNSPVLQFRVGRMPAFWLMSTMIGVPSVMEPAWSGFSTTSFRNISFDHFTKPSMSGSSTPPVPFTATALRFFEDRKSTRLNSSHGYISYAD